MEIPGQESFFSAKEMNAIERSGRRGLVKRNFGYATGGGMWGGDGLTSFKPNIPDSSRNSMSPTSEVEGMIAGTSIPTQDLVAGATQIRSNSPRNSWGNALGQNVGAQFSPMSGVIDYNRDWDMDNKRYAITHEIGHAVANSSLTSTERAQDIDKILRYGKEDSKNLTRYHRGPKGIDQLESLPLSSAAGLTMREGSAEGYSAAHSKEPRNPIGGYVPEHFGEPGTDLNELFTVVRENVRQLGQVVSDKDIMETHKLAGVLESDLGVNGKRNVSHDSQTAARMGLLTQGGRMEHLPEYRLRQKAIYGEVVQGSAFPDVVPETDQFGGAPVGNIERSPRGEALFRGEPTEVPRRQTMPLEAQRQTQITRERSKARWDGPPDPLSPHRPLRKRLQAHVEEKAARDAAAAARPSTNTGGGGTELPSHINDWLGKLVYARKRDYSEEYARHRHLGGDEPAIPTGLKPEHAEAARKKIDRLLG